MSHSENDCNARSFSVLLAGRGGEKEGYFKMHKVESYPKDTSEKGSAFTTQFDWTAQGESITSSVQYFKPPCLTGQASPPPQPGP